MPTPIEQRKDIFEINKDLKEMNLFRKELLSKIPGIWVLIHKDAKTGNYGLEVNNSFGSPCTKTEQDQIKQVISDFRYVLFNKAVNKDEKSKKIKPKNIPKTKTTAKEVK